MTPKEKAKELVEKFTMDNTRQGERNGIKCALIAVEEILAVKPLWDLKDVKELNYWLKVKNQINKL